ncbi:phosphate/phosphite/phosphonate ABC transporter substrate-binding protein [Thiogranum longum]|nr:phosphate/phosphite/phosphonate ABC transporter substrate-binding protein [Thiogranum longum]
MTNNSPGKIFVRAIAITVLLLVSAQASADTPQQRPAYLTFGFLPIVSPERLVKRFAPLVDYLSRETGIEIRMVTAPDFLTFVHRTQDEQRYDLLFTAPHLYYLAHARRGYHVIARVDRPGMQAVIVAPHRSRIYKLQDLRSKRLATTDPLALTTVLVREHLEANGIDPDNDLTLVATPSHNASLLSAYQGATDAAALILPLFRRANPQVRESMRIIDTTRMVPHMPIAVAPWIDPALGERIASALVSLNESPDGRTLLSHLDWPGFVTANEEEYASLEGIVRALKVP